MANSSQGVCWKDPSTPATPRQPLSSLNSGPNLLPAPAPSSPAAATIATRHFYRNVGFTFTPNRTPGPTFSYSPTKRKRVSYTDENTPFGSSQRPSPAAAPPSKRDRTTTNGARTVPESTPSAGSKTKPRRASPRTDSQKIETILATIHAQNWSFACFIYSVFRRRDDKGEPVHRSQVHAQMVSAFLAGRAKKTVSHILTEWMASSDGRIPANSPNRDLMYSTTVPYTDIKPVRAAMTSFSTQMMGRKVAQEAEAVHK